MTNCPSGTLNYLSFCIRTNKISSFCIRTYNTTIITYIQNTVTTHIMHGDYVLYGSNQSFTITSI